MFIALVGASEPFDGPGTLWRAVDGGPPYRRIVTSAEEITPDQLSTPPGVETWIGRLRWPAEIDGDAADDGPAGAGGLLVFAQEPRPGDEEEFDAWMDTEHLPALAGVSGTLRARRYEAISGHPRFAAVYHLRSPEVCTSDEWRAASRTPWRERMSPRNQHRARGLYVPEE